MCGNARREALTAAVMANAALQTVLEKQASCLKASKALPLGASADAAFQSEGLAAVADVLQAAATPAASLLNGQHSPVAVVQTSTRSARATTSQDCGRQIIMATVRVGDGACLGERFACSQAEVTTIYERWS